MMKAFLNRKDMGMCKLVAFLVMLADSFANC
jgi:hypothetical protein